MTGQNLTTAVRAVTEVRVLSAHMSVKRVTEGRNALCFSLRGQAHIYLSEPK
jgi:hypothetical protein